MNPSHRTSKPYRKFIKTQRRSQSLADAYFILSKKKLTRNRDLLRSGIVLSIASMDAYFTDKFCDLVVPVIKKKRVGDSLVQLLADAGLDTRQALVLLAMERPYRRIRTLVTVHMARRVTQRLDAIDELFLCLGIRNFCVSIEGTLDRKNLLKRVRKLVDRRHKIVHDGDYDRHQKLRKLELEKTKLYLKEVVTFVNGAEDFLNENL